MNSRHLILIVGLGTGLIVLAPTPEKAGQADKVETASEPTRDVNVIPAQEESADQAKLEPASFVGDTENLKDGSH